MTGTPGQTGSSGGSGGGAGTTLPYKIATLVDLRDASGRVLLLRRLKAPNLGLCSPIGGKLEMATGESPAQCAQRETMEEVGLSLPIERFALLGIISERAYEGRGHWLIFYYRVTGTVHVDPHDTPDGRLEWFAWNQLDALPLPETDRRIIWPLVKKHDHEDPSMPLGFFSVHIDCSGPTMTWHVEQG